MYAQAAVSIATSDTKYLEHDFRYLVTVVITTH